jgi:hypothetical protein
VGPPELDAVAALARRADATAWFAAVGQALGPTEHAAAAQYLGGLGLVDLALVGVADWHAARALADAPDWDPAWWDAEERLRGALLARAGARHGRAPLLQALTEVAQRSSERAHEHALAACRRAAIADPALARAASGAASQAGYLAALARADSAAAEHPFLAKYRLFEVGRWPLGIVRGRFHVF